MPLLLLPLLAVIAPLLLWPIEFFLPYPHVFEELAKAILVFFLLYLPKREERIKLALLLGLLFSLSENILYLFNIFTVASAGAYFNRLVSTTALHIATIQLILIPTFLNKRLLPLGLLLAIIVHFLYNQIVAN